MVNHRRLTIDPNLCAELDPQAIFAKFTSTIPGDAIAEQLIPQYSLLNKILY